MVAFITAIQANGLLRNQLHKFRYAGIMNCIHCPRATLLHHFKCKPFEIVHSGYFPPWTSNSNPAKTKRVKDIHCAGHVGISVLMYWPQDHHDEKWQIITITYNGLLQTAIVMIDEPMWFGDHLRNDVISREQSASLWCIICGERLSTCESQVLLCQKCCDVRHAVVSELINESVKTYRYSPWKCPVFLI